jgi:hypothetical protein
MYIELTRIPVPVRRLHSFDALNPWRDCLSDYWDLAVFRMVSPYLAAEVAAKAAAQPDPRPLDALNADEVLGITSRYDGSYHMLSTALQRLYRSGRVPVQQLPELTFRTEREITTWDYPGGSRIPLLKVLTGFCVFAALLCIVAYFVLNAKEVHSIAIHSTDEWLTAPMQPGQGVSLRDSVPVAGTMRLPIDLPTPKNLHSVLVKITPPYVIVVVKAKNENRLVLMDAVAASNLKYTLLYGVVIPVAESGIPRQYIDALKANVPNLNTTTILFHQWRWNETLQGLQGGPGWLYGAFYSLLFGALPLLGIVVLNQRLRSQEARILQLMAGAPVPQPSR